MKEARSSIQSTQSRSISGHTVHTVPEWVVIGDVIQEGDERQQDHTGQEPPHGEAVACATSGLHTINDVPPEHIPTS